MHIGSVPFHPPTILAPLAGITNLPFRLMAKAAGCGLVCSEMISANGLIHHSRKTFQMLESDAREKPLSIQLFGVKPDIMAEAAAMVEAAGADILDINFGCSVKKVIKTGAGAALMATPETAEAMLKAVRAAISISLTIKIRSGWDASGKEALAMAAIAEHCGVDAIAVHPRTALQAFRGHADWSLIAAVKQRVSIPVIGNGDIHTPQDALRMFAQTRCDAVMIGRAAIGNPLMFAQIRALLEGKTPPVVDIDRLFDMMRDYLDATIRYFGEVNGCRMMRSRLNWFVRGLPRCSRFREAITHIRTESEARALIEDYRDTLLQSDRIFSPAGTSERPAG
jgi:nifR3 family TIM-barrel protein